MCSEGKFISLACSGTKSALETKPQIFPPPISDIFKIFLLLFYICLFILEGGYLISPEKIFPFPAWGVKPGSSWKQRWEKKLRSPTLLLAELSLYPFIFLHVYPQPPTHNVMITETWVQCPQKRVLGTLHGAGTSMEGDIVD